LFTLGSFLKMIKVATFSATFLHGWGVHWFGQKEISLHFGRFVTNSSGHPGTEQTIWQNMDTDNCLLPIIFSLHFSVHFCT
jgi:hypothetical protein